MAKESLLKQINQDLSHFYHITEENKYTLSISADVDSIPIAFVSVFPDLPEVISLSLATDLNSGAIAAHIAILLSQVSYVELAEEFYVDDKTGHIYYGSEAKNKCEIDTYINLEEIEAINQIAF